MFCKSEERTFKEILDRLTDNKIITPIEIKKFQMAEFRDVIDDLAERLEEKNKLSMPYKFPRSVPEIIAKFNEKAPNLFSQIAPSTTFYSYKHRGGENISATELTLEDKRNNIEAKRRFNVDLSNDILYSLKFKQISNDYDPVQPNPQIEEKEFRDIHLSIGNMLVESIRTAVVNGSEIDILMAVKKKDGSPFAIKPARRLKEIGVNVYNYDEGEKCGTCLVAKLNDIWKENLDRALEKFPSDSNIISDKTGLEKDSVKKIISGEKIPDYFQAFVLEDYFSQEAGSPRAYPLTETKRVFFGIYREIPIDAPGNQLQPGGTQFHSRYDAFRMSGWETAYCSINNYITNVMTPDKLVSLEELTVP